MDLAHGKTSFICGAGLCRSGLPGLSAGCQGYRRHDGNRGHELRSLAVYARASIRGNRLAARRPAPAVLFELAVSPRRFGCMPRTGRDPALGLLQFPASQR